MANQTGQTITKLKEIVDRESRNYLADEPYKVFTELTETCVADKKTAGATLVRRWCDVGQTPSRKC